MMVAPLNTAGHREDLAGHSVRRAWRLSMTKLPMSAGAASEMSLTDSTGNSAMSKRMCYQKLGTMHDTYVTSH